MSPEILRKDNPVMIMIVHANPEQLSVVLSFKFNRDSHQMSNDEYVINATKNGRISMASQDYKENELRHCFHSQRHLLTIVFNVTCTHVFILATL